MNFDENHNIKDDWARDLDISTESLRQRFAQANRLFVGDLVAKFTSM